MTASAMQDAAFTAGDAADQFAAIGVHSTVMKQMVQKDLIQYIQDSQGNIILTTYLGKPIFMGRSEIWHKSIPHHVLWYWCIWLW
ncbi:hypothetical protein NQ805_12205 [Acinetobacter baumannii]|nr:hypothetical protein [Acinetobacter baumannii]